MRAAEDEDEYKGAADSSPSPTFIKPKPAAAGGGGPYWGLKGPVPPPPLPPPPPCVDVGGATPASPSAAIGRFSSPKPPAPNEDHGLLLHAGRAKPRAFNVSLGATPANDNGTPASNAASTISSAPPLPLASLQPQHGEDRVAGLGAGMGVGDLGLVPPEEQVRPTAEDREKECLSADECSEKRNDLSLRPQEEREQCQGDELGASVAGCMVQDQSNNAGVEQCGGYYSAWEVNEKVTDQEVVVGSKEEDEDVVELCTGDQLRTTTEDSSGHDQDLVEQEEETEYYTALEAVEQCTNDGSEAVKDDNIVEEEERAVELKGALDVLDAAKDGAPVKSQEEDVAIAEQEGDEDVISVQDQHKVVDQCSGNQLITAADDNAAQGQDVVKHEGATEYYIAAEAVEQCINYGSRAIKDGNLVEEKDKVMEQVVSFGVLYAAKGCATGESQEDGDVVVEEQIEDIISVQDQHKVVELFTGDQLKATADDNAVQDQEVREQEGATKYYTTLQAVEECTNDESRVVKDGNVVEEKEKLVKQEGAVGILNAAKINIIVEWQEEDVIVAEQCEGVISVHNQDKVVKQCTSGQVKKTKDDNAAEGQLEVVELCTGDHLRITTEDKSWQNHDWLEINDNGTVHLTIVVDENSPSPFEYIDERLLKFLAEHSHPESIPDKLPMDAKFDPLGALGSRPLLEGQTFSKPPTRWVHIHFKLLRLQHAFTVIARPDNLYVRGFENEAEGFKVFYELMQPAAQGMETLERLPSEYKATELDWDVKYAKLFNCEQVDLQSKMLQILNDRTAVRDAIIFMSCYRHNVSDAVIAKEKMGILILRLIEFLRLNFKDSYEHLLGKIQCWRDICTSLRKWKATGYKTWIGNKRLTDIGITEVYHALKAVRLILNVGLHSISGDKKDEGRPHVKKERQRVKKERKRTDSSKPYSADDGGSQSNATKDETALRTSTDGSCSYGSSCHFNHPQEAIDGGTDNEHGFDTKSENVLQQQEKTIYPQRPGEPECSHYMKHGYS